jgi:hypothetical protein
MVASAQLREALHVADRHTGRAQALQKRQPRQVVGAVTTLPAVDASYWIEQADPLVVAQRVRADATALGGLFDGVRRLHISHAKN